MPSKDFYQNDALIIQSIVFSCAQLVFLTVFMWKFGWLRRVKRILKGEETGYLSPESGTRQFYELMLGSWALSSAAVFNIGAFAFYFAGMFLNFNDYGQNGFYCGLLDGNPNRVWYYIVALILVAFNAFALWWFETRARYRLRVMAGLDNFITDDLLEPLASAAYASVRGTGRSVTKGVKGLAESVGVR